MTKTATRFLLAVLLLAVVVACSSTGGGRLGREKALRAELEALPLPDDNVVLVADLAGEDGLDVHSVTLTSRHLIVEGDDGKLYALDRVTMMPAWHYYGLPRTLDFPIYEAAGSYLMITANTLVQIHKTTGAEMSVSHLEFTPSTAPGGNDVTAYVGSWSHPNGNKTLYSVNLADGSEGWGFRTQGHITATPIVGGAPRQLVYVASHDGMIYGIETKGAFEPPPSPAWAQQAFGRNTANLTLTGDLLLVPSEEGALYALDKATGNRVWEYTSGKPLRSAAAATANAVYFDNEYGFHRLDRNGNLLWQLTSGTMSFVLERDGAVWLKNAEAVMVYDGDDGSLQADQESGHVFNLDLDGWFVPANDMNGTFYAVSEDGFAFAYTQRVKLQ
jgi:outer membrane protein assembly factor BamB